MKNIALIGFMGSGKTTLAGILAANLHYQLREIDEDIVRISEYKNVNEIFANKGEEYFRELEKKVIADAVKKNKQVISCGGGVVSSKEIMELLKKNALVIFLHADFKTVTQRLRDTSSRPLFRDMEKAMALYAKRVPLYEKYADIKIETDHNSPEEVAKEIMTTLGKYES